MTDKKAIEGAAGGSERKAPKFTSIRITVDTHLVLLKIVAKRLLETGRQENIDQVIGEIVDDYRKRNYPDIK